MSERDGVKVARTLRDAISRLDLRPGVLLDEAELGDSPKPSANADASLKQSRRKMSPRQMQLPWSTIN